MKLHQLRYLAAIAESGLNISAAAEKLHTSQPGVSRQIRELEDELGLQIFVRAGKRLTGLTAPGEALLPIVERLLEEAGNLKRAGDDFAQQGRGTLRIAATHSQARYALPHAVRDFRAGHPQVALHMHQGSPHQIARLLLDGGADVGIATEALAQYDELVAMPCYSWTHVVVVPGDHELAHFAQHGGALTLQQLARFPIVTYESGYTGRAHIDEAFHKAGLTPDVVLQAMDADVIKTYVELGLGVGIVAAIAFDDTRDQRLRAIDARHLFAANMTRLAVRRGSYLRDFVYDFIATFAPPLTKALVRRALDSPAGSDPGL